MTSTVSCNVDFRPLVSVYHHSELGKKWNRQKRDQNRETLNLVKIQILHLEIFEPKIIPSVASHHKVSKNSSDVKVLKIRGRRIPKKIRFPVMHDHTKTKPRSVPGYARLHKNVTKVGSRLRLVTQKRNQDRFPVTVGYTKNVTKAGSRLHKT